MEKPREKASTSALLTAKAVGCVDLKKKKKQWKNLQEMEIPDHLTCLLRNLYAGQAATVTTGHGPTDWFQIGNEYVKLSDTTERLN